MQEETLKNARILIVDDQEPNVRLLECILLQSGYGNLKSTCDPRQVLLYYAAFEPDLILLDLHMPHLDGFELIQSLQSQVAPGAYLPILVLTADVSVESKQKALAMGARDFLNKPFDITEVLLRIRNLLETRFLYAQLQNQNLLLEERVRARTSELEEARIEILERLALAAEFRDDATGQHTHRVGRMSAMLAEGLQLPAERVELIRRAAPLHDLGKIGIPDHILLKPGRLAADEYELMKNHTTIGSRILSGSRFPVLQVAEEIALSHQERWDGSGYPRGLSGEEIPLVGRIVAVADVYDALTQERPYKAAWSPPEAVEEIRRQSGRQFDPQLVEVFMESCWPQLTAN